MPLFMASSLLFSQVYTWPVWFHMVPNLTFVDTTPSRTTVVQSFLNGIVDGTRENAGPVSIQLSRSKSGHPFVQQHLTEPTWFNCSCYDAIATL